MDYNPLFRTLIFKTSYKKYVYEYTAMQKRYRLVASCKFNGLLQLVKLGKKNDTKSNFQLFCCIWHTIFVKKVEQTDLFVDLLCFCSLKL